MPLEPLTQDSIREMLNSHDAPQRVKAGYLLGKLARGESLVTSYPAPIQVARFGDQLLLIALSGEPVVDWAHKFKQKAWDEQGVKTPTSCSTLRAPCPPLIWVAGYCNDMFGYLPTRRLQREGGYEGGRANLWSPIPAPFTEDVENIVTAAVGRLVQRVS